jgi:phosphate/sulfate permease
VREMGVAWVTTVPATALVAAGLFVVWRLLS